MRGALFLFLFAGAFSANTKSIWRLPWMGRCWIMPDLASPRQERTYVFVEMIPSAKQYRRNELFARHRFAMYHGWDSWSYHERRLVTTSSLWFSLSLSVHAVGSESVGVLSRGMEGTWQWEQRKHCHIILLNSLLYLRENPEQTAGESFEIGTFLARSILISWEQLGLALSRPPPLMR